MKQTPLKLWLHSFVISIPGCDWLGPLKLRQHCVQCRIWQSCRAGHAPGDCGKPAILCDLSAQEQAPKGAQRLECRHVVPAQAGIQSALARFLKAQL